MRKFLFYFILILFNMFFVYEVNAAKCVYEYGAEKLIFYTSEEDVKDAVNITNSYGKSEAIYSTVVGKNKPDGTLMAEHNVIEAVTGEDTCVGETVYFCTIKEYTWIGIKNYTSYRVYPSEYNSDYKEGNDWDLMNFLSRTNASCDTYSLSEESKKFNQVIHYVEVINNYQNQVLGLIDDCKTLNKISQEGENICSTDTYQNYHKYRDNINSFCGNVFSNYNYNDEYFNSCEQILLQMNEWDDFFQVNNINEENDCSFSGKLLAWISNILRWIKYILPVGVILLGILDFIKAVANDKDDEMKKAQGRFIKRLIAAALVFIIPLIIQFILEKMGFGYDSCSLF